MEIFFQIPNWIDQMLVFGLTEVFIGSVMIAAEIVTFVVVFLGLTFYATIAGYKRWLDSKQLLTLNWNV